MNAPERIWTETDQFGPHWRGPDILNGMTEFVRADLFAALEAKAQDLQAKLTECCLQCLATDGQADEALARAEKAEAEHMETLGRLAGNVAKVAEQKALLKEMVEALEVVKADCVSRMPLSRDGRTVPIGDGAWIRLCATLAKIKDAQNG